MSVDAKEHGHDHPHGNGRGHSGHDHHSVSRESDRRYLIAAAALLTIFLIGEVVAGILSGSLALLTDAGHMLSDVAALVLALVAMRLADRPNAGRYTFGLKRSEILSAQVNGIVLIGLGVWFLVEGVQRMIDPPEVPGGVVLAVALAGVAVNVVATLLLARANRSSLNVEGAFQHLLTDLYAFIGTAVAGLVILVTGWERADPIAALIVAALMLRSGYRLIRDSGRVLLEAAPAGVDPRELRAVMGTVPGVVDVHDLHVWEVTSGFVSLSAHVLVEDSGDCHQARLSIQRQLAEREGITHTTIQVDHVGSHERPRDAEACCDDPRLDRASASGHQH